VLSSGLSNFIPIFGPLTPKALHNEHILLQRVAEGDQQAFAALYHHYLPMLYRYVFPFVRQSHQETEEILQDIFLKLWMRKETLPALQSFGPYLLRMARNRVLDGLRRQKLHAAYLQDAATMADAIIPDPEWEIRYKEYNRAAQLALQQMTRKRRQIFLWHTQLDMTLEEIARAMGISRSTVKKQLYAATALIKLSLLKNGEWMTLLILWLVKKI
jgi:RNA polymerase sigma-70 factor (family 1)